MLVTRCVTLLAVLLVASLVCVPASGQTTYGALLGTVTDTTGAAVAGARLELVNKGTNRRFTTQSGPHGNYEFPLISPGEYQLTGELQGFKRVVRDNITISVNQRASLDLSLELGQVTETVEVTTSAPLLDAESSSLGGVITGQQVIDLPLNARQVFTLATLNAGVVPSNVSDSFNTAVNFSTDGSQRQQAKVLVDGLDATLNVNNPSFQGVSAFPSVDAVQEFKLQANAFSAEFGRAAGGVVNVALKSGTNDVHGSAYEFLRNSSLDANNFFANRNGVPLGSFKRNQFGGTLGGPVYIPGLYNGRNKTFFFFSFEGLRSRSVASANQRVPTELERAGDFSQTFTAAGAPIVNYDPGTVARQGNNFVRMPFEGNRIPAGSINAISRRILEFLPLPNNPGQGPARLGNFAAQSASINDNERIDTKLDQSFGDAGRLTVKYNRFNRQTVSPNFYGNPGGGGAAELVRTYNAGMEYTHVLSPTVIGNMAAGFSRLENPRRPTVQEFDVTSIGLPSIINQRAGARVFPFISIDGVNSLGTTPDIVLDSFANLYQTRGSVSLVRGKQSIKIGGEVQRREVNHSQGGNTGTYNFNRNFTQGPNALAPSPTGGFGLATFLLGHLSGGTFPIQPYISTANYNWGIFVQDDVRLTRNLTLNLGLRYEVEHPRVERFDQQTYWDLDSLNPIGASVGFPVRGGLQFTGVNGNPRSPYNTDRNNISPRFGFAWSGMQNWVVRGAYGIFYGIAPVGAAGLAGGNVVGFSASTPILGSIDSVTPFTSIDNPFPNGLIESSGSATGLGTQLGQGVSSVLRDTPTPYSQQWNFNIQRSLPGNIVLETAYAGSRGVNLQVLSYSYNQLPDQYLALGPQLLETVPNPFFGQISVGELAQRTVQRRQLLRPYLQFTGLNVPKHTIGQSNYHSLQVRGEKRFSAGVSFLATYTWSKLITDSDAAEGFLGDIAPYQNFNDFRNERSLSAMDIPHRFVASYTIQLPFGRGKTFGRNWHPVAEAVLGGWQVNGITTLASGKPLNITTGATVQSVGFGTQRPDSTGRSAKRDSYQNRDDFLNRNFDTSAFVQPEPFRFGNLGRTVPDVRSYNTIGTDFSIFKIWRFAERFRLQLRGEAFNVFNRVEFAEPNQNLSNSNFGVINGQANTPRQLQIALRLSF